jgi:mannose-1-phosphate guanylyltransferase
MSDRNYKALLLAAGFGTRLKPATDIWPKCLMPVQGRPLLDYWIATLSKAGLSHILVNLHYMASEVEGFIKREKFQNSIKASVEKELLGTAGTIRANRNFFGNSPLIVAHADNLCLCDFNAFIHHHEINRPDKCLISMMSFDCDDPSNCGIIDVDEFGVVHGMSEKDPNSLGKLANGAVYIFEPEVIDWIYRNNRVTDISTGVIPNFFGNITHWKNNEIHRDIGRIEDLKEVQKKDIYQLPEISEASDDWQQAFAQHPIHDLIKKQ